MEVGVCVYRSVHGYLSNVCYLHVHVQKHTEPANEKSYTHNNTVHKTLQLLRVTRVHNFVVQWLHRAVKPNQPT